MEIGTLLDVITVVIVFALVSQKITKSVVKWLFGKILKTAINLAETKNELHKKAVAKERPSLLAVAAKKKELGFITHIIGVAELIIFAILMVLLIHEELTFLELISSFLKFVGAWIGIKTLGSYNQWAGAIFGRACFYLFLIGTLLNIIFAVLMGMVLALLL